MDKHYPNEAVMETAPPDVRVSGRTIGWRLIIPALLLATIVAAAIFAPLITPYHPYAQDLTARLKPPVWLNGGDMAHILGTDELGRDLLTRILYGARSRSPLGHWRCSSECSPAS